MYCIGWEAAEYQLEGNLTSEEMEVCPNKDTEILLNVIDNEGNIIEVLNYKVHVIEGEPPALTTQSGSESEKDRLKAILEYSCSIANKINMFLEDSDDTYDVVHQNASIGLSEMGELSRLDLLLFEEMTDKFDHTLDFPEDESIHRSLAKYLTEERLNFGNATYEEFLLDESFDTDPSGDDSGASFYTSALPCPVYPYPIPGSLFGWEPFRSGHFFAAGNQFEAFFDDNYPDRTTTIAAWFKCFTYGGLHEQIVLDALGLPQNNTAPSNFDGKPDGYGKGFFLDRNTISELDIFRSPIMVEVKCRYADQIFDYSSSNSTQLNRYLNYLSDPNHTYLPENTVSHGLILVLPSDVALKSSDVEKFSSRNIPLYISWTEKKTTTTPDESQFLTRVIPPQLQNADKLNYSHTNARRFPYWLVEARLEYRMICTFDYNTIEADFDHWASRFEDSYLQPSTEPSDAEENCDDKT